MPGSQDRNMKNSVRDPVRKIIKTTGEGSNNVEPTVVNLRTPLEIKEKIQR